MVTGALLTPANVYSGLKIGWTFNMSVTAGLLGFAFWSALHRPFAQPAWGIYENNINQTAASSAASIISAGLAAPIPALALLTGQTLAFPVLATWLFVVSILGIVVAAGLRNQLLFRERLPFPSGVVTAETMTEIHGGGKAASARLKLLALAGFFSAGLKSAVTVFAMGPLAPAVKTNLAMPAKAGGVKSVSAMNLGLALDPSLLMVGFGAIAGLRIGVSAIIGAVLAWAVLGPVALSYGWAQPGPDDAARAWFGPMVEWLLWPGATLMVVASLASFALSVAKLRARRRASEPAAETEPPMIGRGVLLAGFAVALVLSVIAQYAIFGIGPVAATLAVVLTFALAIVAARVSGETGITPIGALGKITQLTFGAITPGNVTSNLMTANVTGGAAGQCADLMHDLRTGHIIGATPGFQVVAQLFGILTGSLVAAITYIALIPDPQAQLITAEWPAPAVATWKAVAEVMSKGFEAMPPGAAVAIIVATIAGLALALAESFAGPRWQRFVPSAPAIGLAFVIPAWNSLSLFIGSAIAALLFRIFPGWSRAYIVVIAAGLIVGESIAGMLGAIGGIFF